MTSNIEGRRLRCPDCDSGLYDADGDDPIYLDDDGKFKSCDEFGASCLSCFKKYTVEAGATLRFAELT